MMELSGYEIESELHSGEMAVVYRAKAGPTNVIVKVLRNEHPDPAEFSAFRHEYDILQRLQADGIVRALAFGRLGGSPAIVFEDTGAVPLHLACSGGLPFSEAIDVMISATEALGEVHQAGIVHRDIKPQNIVINRETGKLQIIDFGSASELARLTSAVSLNRSIDGTLAYVSPEQTGRMNRTVDYRTDMYSLGITFYQLLTGDVPFRYSDPLELVHAHIARTPVSPFSRNNTPAALSRIVMKLLEKNPEDRYQSTQGLLHDLQTCRNCLLQSGLDHLRDLDLRPGKYDLSSRFQIPEKLYGRSREIEQIIQTFKDIRSGRTELLLISGHSGIGKSALINEVRKPITEYRGYFATGKYDAFKRNVPYRAITQSLQHLIRQILTEPEKAISAWKEKIQHAVGTNGRVVIEVIPELQTLIGEQPEIASLGAEEAQNRFSRVFQNLIQALATKEHPLALFLDDMQWADSSSLHLIKTLLLNPQIQHLCMILSFRDNEVPPSSPFARMIDELKIAERHPRELLLQPLTIADVREMVRDTLSCDDRLANDVALTLHEKTNGNPFFVLEVFRSYYEKDLIRHTEAGWQVDMSGIQDVRMADNVIEFMVDRVRELPEKSQEVLKLAACVGNWFRQDVFADILKEADHGTVRRELIHLANEGFLRLGTHDATFMHDRIREAAYAMTSDSERAANHYRISNAYLSMLDRFNLEDNVFTIVNQMNQGAVHITTEEEITTLRQLNTMAGNKSLASNAYEAACGFFRQAIQTLPDRAWQNEYELTLDLHTLLARAEYLDKDYEAAERTFDLILKNARRTHDRIPVYELRSAMYVSQNRMREALQLLKEALKTLSVHLPANPNRLSVISELLKFKMRLGKKPVQGLVDLPVMQDEDSLAIMRLLVAAVAPAFLTQPSLFPVIVLKMLNVSLKKGNSPLSPFAYVSFGIIQGSVLGDFDSGYAFGSLSLELVSRFGNAAKSIECRTVFMFQTMINHWKFHAREGKSFYRQAFNAGLESGDLQFSSYSLNNVFFQGLLMRENLDDLAERFSAEHPVIASLQQYNAYQLFQLNEQSVLNLKGEADDLLKLTGKYFDETKVLSEWLAAKNANALFDFYVAKSRLEYLFGDSQKAYEYALLAEPMEDAMSGMMFVPEQLFFLSLAAAAIYPEAQKKLRKQIRQRLEKNAKRFEKWSYHCEANYGHKYLIVKGLLSQIQGDTSGAMASYRKAAVLAGRNAYLLEEAIAHELSAAIWEESADDLYSKQHLIRALQAYRSWGCSPKVQALEARLPEAMRRQVSALTGGKSTTSDRAKSPLGSQNGGRYFDILSVLKASQAISGEIQLGKLLETMMSILLESAGAEKGSFILLQKGQWYIEAESNANTQSIEVLQGKPLGATPGIGVNIVNYVIRTKSVVLLDDATREGMFVNDSYVKATSPKSLLCYPILHKGEVIAVVYLENNLTTEAFTPDRMEVLRVLSAQIAISIENSLLYATLQENVQEIAFQALHDELTGLGNRRSFEEKLALSFDEGRADTARHVLFYMDLDEFKVVNDTCGHAAGDELLRQVGILFRQCLTRDDVLCRLGGDEFGAILKNRDIPQAVAVADSMQRALSDFRFQWNSRQFSVAVCVGIVAIDGRSESPGAILQAADTACYVAKEAGRNRIHIHSYGDPALAQRYGEMEWVSRIEHALQKNTFVLHGQLIQALQAEANGERRCEILLRMLDQDGKIVRPQDFMPAVERYHLATRVDRWVIEHALQWLATLKDHPVECSINISGRSLGDPGFLSDVIRILDSTDIRSNRLCFEITETAAIGNMLAAGEFFTAMKDRGCLFALDDFGSGLASFGYLRNLPVDYLKIDGQFVRAMTADPLNLAIVKSVHEIACILGKQTIAEYVEDSAALSALTELGIHFAQGYALGHPVPLEGLFHQARD